MARRPLTDRQLQLDQALANLKGERAVLKQQQARVAAARTKLDSLSRCDCCGVRVVPCGADEQLCLDCFRQRREQDRVALLAQHGYDRCGKRLGQAA